MELNDENLDHSTIKRPLEGIQSLSIFSVLPVSREGARSLGFSNTSDVMVT